MATLITFKPGMKQADRANVYFQSLANDIVGVSLDRYVAKQLIIQEGGHAQLKLRLWSEHGGKRLRTIIPWIRHLLHITEHITRTAVDPATYFSLLGHCGNDRISGFIEVLGASAFTDDEELMLTIGLEEGNTVLLSTPRLIYVQQEESLYGLSIFGRGSWLIERKAEMGIPLPASH